MVAGIDQLNDTNSFCCVIAVNTLHPIQHLLDGLIRDVPLIIAITDEKTYRQTNQQTNR